MTGTPAPGAGTRRDKDGSSNISLQQKTPRNGITPNKTTSNGRSTPVRGRPGESNFIHANAAWGYETPSHKILTNIPSSVTVRSSERRRRLKTDGSDDSTSNDKPPSSNFVESRYAKVKTPTPDVPPRGHFRSGSNGSVVSDRGISQPRKLSKVSSFTSVSANFAPSTNKENFFHAKEVHDRGPVQLDISEKFFTADKAKSPSAMPSTNTSRQQRRLSISSQFSSFTSAKEVCQNNPPPQYSIPPISNPSSQPRSPTSPTKLTFLHSNSSPDSNSPTSNTMSRNNPLSPLRSNFVTVNTPSPTPEPSTFPQATPKHSPPIDTITSSSSSSSNPIEIFSDISDDEQTSKSLVPTTLDLENSARINRKIADLEISNSSLLAVNQNLERTTRQQALELRALKRQLRHSLRLSVIPHPISPLEDSASDEEEEEEPDVDDDGTAAETGFRLRLDKCVFLSEQMLVEGRRGLEYRVTASELVTGRVISGEWKEQERAAEVMS